MERRSVLKLAVGGALLTACTPDQQPRSEPSVPSPSPGPAGRLFADTDEGLAVIDTADGRVLRTHRGAVPAADWSRLYLTGPGGLTTIRTDDGAPVATVPGPSQPVRVVSASGQAFALGDAPGPRRRTTITVVGPAGTRRFSLDGNYEPEAFSQDDGALFVLEHRPPLRPDRYRVRMYDLRAGRVMPLLSRVKVPVRAEEEMRGQGRQSVLSAGRDRLYTLYTHQPEHQHTRDLVTGRDDHPEVHAFVHVLDLAGRWAFCIDLPPPFGLGPAAAHTIAVDDRTLFVYDATSGRLALPDTDRPVAGRTLSLTARPGSTAYAATGRGALYLAAGRSVWRLNARSFSSRLWHLPAPARGLALPGAPTDLYVGQPGQVLRLDPDTGAERGRFAVPGLRQLRHAR
jgi:hypothetical protein